MPLAASVHPVPAMHHLVPFPLALDDGHPQVSHRLCLQGQIAVQDLLDVVLYAELAKVLLYTRRQALKVGFAAR